jgi:hypothetical protein
VDEARYRIALKVAKAKLRSLGRSSVDGKDAHDLAMESLHVEPWFPHVVRCDVIDAYRRERGRDRGRRMVGIPPGLAARMHEREDGFDLEIVGRTEVLICELLAAGYRKDEAAAVIGVTPARVSQIINRIRKRNAHVEAKFQQRKESTDGP